MCFLKALCTTPAIKLSFRSGIYCEHSCDIFPEVDFYPMFQVFIFFNLRVLKQVLPFLSTFHFHPDLHSLPLLLCHTCQKHVKIVFLEIYSDKLVPRHKRSPFLALLKMTKKANA